MISTGSALQFGKGAIGGLDYMECALFFPHLGTVALQALRPAQIEAWHSTLLRAGGANGGPLSPRTVGHAHRLLHSVLEHAARLEAVGRNVASVVSPPRVIKAEIEILSAGQVGAVLACLADHSLLPIVSTALGTGMRRGELCGLGWGTVELDKATVRVERSPEETRAGLRFKPPETANGRRTISLAKGTVAMLRETGHGSLNSASHLGLESLPRTT